MQSKQPSNPKNAPKKKKASIPRESNQDKKKQKTKNKSGKERAAKFKTLLS